MQGFKHLKVKITPVDPSLQDVVDSMRRNGEEPEVVRVIAIQTADGIEIISRRGDAIKLPSNFFFPDPNGTTE